MHIGFCAPVTYKAFETYLNAPGELPAEEWGLLADIATAYLERGHRVTIVSWSRALPATRVWRGQDLAVIAVPMRNLSTRLPALVREMANWLSNEKPDVVHAHWLYEYADAALGSGIPALVTAHDAPWRIATRQQALYWWYRAAYAQLRVLPRIRFLTAVSPYTEESMRRQCRYRRRLEMIPNGIPARHHAEAPRQRRLHPNNVTLVSISNWSPLKNVPAALQAFALVRKQYPGARLILVGNGLGADEAAQSYAEERELHHGVIFKGAILRDTMYALLRDEADIHLHTSREEACCMAVLESMSQAVPCVAGNASGGIPWMLDGGAAGVLVDIESPEAVAAAILSLLDDEAHYARISAAAWQQVRTIFAFDRVIDRYLEILAELARK
jgi:glycosyltransferase involved in cell wall biosynthesis